MQSERQLQKCVFETPLRGKNSCLGLEHNLLFIKQMHVIQSTKWLNLAVEFK